MATLQDLFGAPGSNLYAQPDPQAALIASILGASAPSGPAPGYVAGPTPGVQGAPDLNSQILDTIKQAAAPPPVMDQKLPNEPKPWQKVLAALADAGSVYASGLNGRIAPTNTTGYLLGQSEMRKAKQEQGAYDKKAAAYQSSVKEAEMKLRDLMARREDLARSADVAQSKQEKQVELQARALEEERKRAFEAQQQEKDHAFKLDLEKLRVRSEGRDGADPAQVKAAAKEQEHFSVGARIALGFRDGLPADPKSGAPAVPPLASRLASGESPDAIREQFEEELDKEGVFGKARDLARNYFNQRMMKAAQQVEAQKAAEAATPPAAPNPGFVRSGVNAWDNAIRGALPPVGN